MTFDNERKPTGLKKLWFVCSKVFRIFFNPELREETYKHLEQMKKDGVDIADRQARKNWIRTHRKELGRLQGREPPRKVSRIRKKSKAGRNDPCPCGSGKKYKKCCMFKNKEGNEEK